MRPTWRSWCFRAADRARRVRHQHFRFGVRNPGGKAEEAYAEAVLGTFELFTSVAILTETARVLQTKLDWTEGRVQEAIQSIGQTAVVLRPHPILHILKDEPDNRILECAIAAQSEYLVSGDRHLLALKQHAGVTMISLAEFLAELRNTTRRSFPKITLLNQLKTLRVRTAILPAWA